MKRATRVLFAVASAGLVGAAAYIGVDEQRRRKASRMGQFWSYALPVYTRYRLEEFRVRNDSEEEKAAAFKQLHNVYAKASDAVRG